MVGGEVVRDDQPWNPSRRTRLGVGMLAGFGAVGIAAGITFMANQLDVALLQLGAIILPAVLTGFAGSVRRERDAVIAIAAGAVLSSLAAIFVVDGPWALVALAAITPWVLAISGLAAFVGGWLGRESTRPNEPRRGVLVLVVFGVVGVGTWMLVAALIWARRLVKPPDRRQGPKPRVSHTRWRSYGSTSGTTRPRPSAAARN